MLEILCGAAAADCVAYAKMLRLSVDKGLNYIYKKLLIIMTQNEVWSISHAFYLNELLKCHTR